MADQNQVQKLSPRAAVELICKKLFAQNVDNQIGQSKVFLKYPQDTYLEKERERMQLKYVLFYNEASVGRSSNGGSRSTEKRP